MNSTLNLFSLLSSWFQRSWDFLKLMGAQDCPQRILWGPVGMGVGITFYFCWPQEPSLFLSILLLAGFIFLFTLFRQHPWGRFIVWPLLCFQLGFCLIEMRVQILKTHMLHEKLDKVQGIGEVYQIDVKEGRKRLIIKNFCDLEGTPYLNAMVRLSIKSSQPLPALGDRIHLVATLMPFSPPLMPEGYDYRRASFFQGIGATGWIDDIEKIESPASKSSWLWLQNCRQFINESLLRLVPGESSAIAAALITGERGYIRDDIRQAYTDAGIAHVLAISGLHLSLIAGIVFMVIRRGLSFSLILGESYDLKKIAGFFTIPFLLGYLLISGMGVPAIRSFIMVSIVMLAILLDRRSISMRLLAFAALIIMCLQPECVLSASFALSFAAVMGLVALYQDGWIPLQKWVLEGGWGRQLIAYLFGIIITTLVASAVTTPISMYIFNRLSVQAILGNLVAIPLTGFIIMPSLLILVLSLPFGGSTFFGMIASHAIHLLTTASVFTANLPGANIPVHQPPILFIWLFVLGTLWLLLWRAQWRYLGFLPIGASLLTFLIPQSPMAIVDSKGYLAWFDGTQLYHFSDDSNTFTEDVLKRRFGLSYIRDIEDDQVSVTLGNNQVAVLNRTSHLQKFDSREVNYSRESLSDIKKISQNHDLILTRFPLKKEFMNDLAEVIVLKKRGYGRGKRNQGTPLYIQFHQAPNGGYKIFNGKDLQGDRPWSAR